MNKLKQIFKDKYPIIGMIHLLPSPGYKNHPGINSAIKQALSELKSLEKGGISGVMVENENDHPHQVKVGPEIVSFMTKIVNEIVKNSKVPVGLEVLLNDPQTSLCIANVTGCKYIRSDYFVDKMERKEYGGEMYINPKELMNFKKEIKADDVALFTDIQVKYAKLLEKGKTYSKSTKQAIKAGSDGVIVTGEFSGDKPKLSDIIETKKAAKNSPVIIGSGFSSNNAKELMKYSDCAIVGSSIKKEGFNTPVDIEKVIKLMEIVKNE